MAMTDNQELSVTTAKSQFERVCLYVIMENYRIFGGGGKDHAGQAAKELPDQETRGRNEPIRYGELAMNNTTHPTGSARTGTDLDLAPIMRTEANYWKAQFFQASRELTKANKGIRRLRNGRDREMSRLRTAIYRYHGNDCLCQTAHG